MNDLNVTPSNLHRPAIGSGTAKRSCPTCGVVVRDTTLTCPSCRTQIDAIARAQAPVMATEVLLDEARSNVVLVVLAGVLLFFGMPFGLASGAWWGATSAAIITVFLLAVRPRRATELVGNAILRTRAGFSRRMRTAVRLAAVLGVVVPAVSLYVARANPANAVVGALLCWMAMGLALVCVARRGERGRGFKSHNVPA